MGKRGPIQGAKHDALRSALAAYDRSNAPLTLAQVAELAKAARAHLARLDQVSEYNRATWHRRHAAQPKG